MIFELDFSCLYCLYAIKFNILNFKNVNLHYQLFKSFFGEGGGIQASFPPN